MAIKNILYHAFAGDAGMAVENAAIILARDHGAALTALTVVDNTPIPAYVVPYVPTNMAESYIEESRTEAKSVEARTQARADKEGLAIEWRYTEGDIRAVFDQHARYADICVVAQGIGDDVPVGPALNLPGDLVLSTGRPILVVPWTWTGTTLGKRVVIGWNASREATRAVHDAMSVLVGADAVKVLTVGPEEIRHIPGAEITAHLAHHGAKAEADHAIERDMSTAENIINAVKGFDADLLVSGAWGHSRIMETVLGGVTRHLLREPPVPLLLSH